MGRHNRGGMLVGVRTGAAVLTCICAISLLSSNNSSALSVDPLLDSVISVVRLDQPENPETKMNHGSTNKSERQATTPSSSSKTSTSSPISNSVPLTPDEPVVTEPLNELPTIDAPSAQLRPIKVSRSDNSVMATSAVLGVKTNDAVSPLQASDEGWKVFGVAWYWWLLGGGFVYYVTRQLISLQRRRGAIQNSVVS